MFYDLGILLHNSSYLSLSTTLDGTSATFWIAAVAILACGAIVAGSTRLAGDLVKYWTILAVIIGIIFIVVVLSAGQSTFISNFNAQYGSNAYQTVVAAGTVAATVRTMACPRSSLRRRWPLALSGSSDTSGSTIPPTSRAR